MTAAIEVSGLVKRFGRVTALDGLDLRVEPGQVAGFLGPNGAGKSTTLRILLGLYRADAGTARVLGGDPWRDAVPLHRRLAYVPGDVTLWPNLTGGQSLDVLASLHGRSDRRRRDELVERFDLDPTKKGRSYSKGNRQKVALIAAFQSDAELLVLDEPTSGLDPLMEEVFTDCVREARLRGASVLLSSHIFAEVERLCDTVTIVRAGRTVEAGTLDGLRHLHRTTVSAEVEASDADLARLEHAADLERTGDRITFSVSDDDLPSTLATLAAMHPRSLVSTPPTLEELFLRHYGTRLEPEAVS